MLPPAAARNNLTEHVSLGAKAPRDYCCVHPDREESGDWGSGESVRVLPPPVEGRGEGAGNLPTGVIVGSAVISRCVRNCTGYEWHLTAVRRHKRPRKPTGRPQPVWFRPW
jgi:hypothetical protein